MSGEDGAAVAAVVRRRRSEAAEAAVAAAGAAATAAAAHSERHPWAPVVNRTLAEARGLPFKDKPAGLQGKGVCQKRSRVAPRQGPECEGIRSAHMLFFGRER